MYSNTQGKKCKKSQCQVRVVQLPPLLPIWLKGLSAVNNNSIAYSLTSIVKKVGII